MVRPTVVLVMALVAPALASAQTPEPTPYDVPPEIINRDEIAQALDAEYPSVLRDAGVGGRVLVSVRIGVDGEVLDTALAQTSGFEELDLAALRVAPVYVFQPATLNGQAVAVWVQIPMTFAPEPGPAARPNQ